MTSAGSSASLRVVRDPTPDPGVTVRLTFPGRRYHATPWGHHVNEGLIEWPPSPWRILRALLATGFTKLHWPDSGPPADARSLMEKLSGVLPAYRLPRAVGTHSRHYMPMARFDKGREQTTLVLDTWAHIDSDWLGIHWDVDVNEAERSVLKSLVRELGYLGRSESWVEGELATNVAFGEFEVLAGEAHARPGPGWEQVALLAPERAERYASWREATISHELAKLPKENAKGKALSKAQLAKQTEALQAAYPRDLLACLQVDTRFLQELGWSQPPGTRKTFYWRPTDSLSPAPALTHRKLPASATATFILLALAAESNNRGNLPPKVRTLPQGELLHRALLSKFPKGNVPSVLSGRDSSGEPLRSEQAHRHAHVLHLDLDGDEHLDHALLWAPMGFDSTAQSAVRLVREAVAKGAKRPHRVEVVAMGELTDILSIHSGANAQLIDRLRATLGGPGGAKEWMSLTPFVPARFLKASGKNSLEGQIRHELTVRGLPEPKLVEILEPNRGSDEDRELARKGRHFIRHRRKGGNPPPADCGFMVRLRFDTDVQGPIVLGYGCHFGLGFFGAR